MARSSCHALLGILLLAAAPSLAIDYYVAAAGNDANPGTAASPWSTIGRVNGVALRAGDRVLFEGGATFGGQLTLNSGDTGTAASPIRITSYGTGRATIAAGNGRGLFAWNTAGLTISNLNFVGSGLTTNTGDGISAYVDLGGGVKLAHLHIDRVEIRGFGGRAIAIGGGNGTSGYKDVRITRAVLHDVRHDGLLTYGAAIGVHEGVLVQDVQAYAIPGLAGGSPHSGNGIVLGSVSGGTIERCVAHDNGAAGTGSVGVWTYDSTGVVIQHNESYNNRTGGTVDGGGFDLDNNVSGSILRYNYSHDNDGAGLLVWSGVNNTNHRDNVVAYNVSQNDGRKNGYGGIHVGGRVYDADIVHNTVFLSPPATGTPAAIVVASTGSGVHVRNNIFQTSGGAQLVRAPSNGTDLRFEGNTYWSGTGTFRLKWGTTTYTSLSAWLAAATTQERVGGQVVGLQVDPKLTAAGAGPVIGTPSQLPNLSAYRLLSTSPLRDKGVDLFALGADPGPRDFYGAGIPQGPRLDVGAHEVPFAGTCASPIVVPAAGGTFTGTTAGTNALTGPCGVSGTSPEQVYRWTPTKSGLALIETCNAGATTYDTVVYVRQSNCTTGTGVACNDDAISCPTTVGNRGSRVQPTVTAGQTYYVVVDGYAGRAGGYSLRIVPPS